ncbi:uncharacterized protein LOC135681076 isoform X2 [Rhopilema esculentum]|uniref:uncharacterized protein LOC135681076 isoform X1 n=1 Tax=Rhopilema esculentum TaxID=499914 RepID=UPI0031D23897
MGGFFSTEMLGLLALFAATSAERCSSRFYCYTPEIKYMAMNAKNNTYLNITAFRVQRTSDIKECQTLCNRDSQCYSINLNITVKGSYECQLLDGNIFSNSSLQLFDSNFIHLYTESICSEKPCQNNGTCVPNYVNGSYLCECRSNKTYKTLGKHCERIATVYETADYYWTFDSFINKPISGTNMDIQSTGFNSNNAAVYEPGRRSRVSYCYGNMNCPLSSASIPCLTKFEGCTDGFTYAIWFKIRQPGESCSILYNYKAGATSMGKILSYNPTTGALTYTVFYTETWSLTGFGQNLNTREWNHLILSFHPTAGICAFSNGKLDKCSVTKNSNSLTNEFRQFRIGFTLDDSPRCQLYTDDFAMWYGVLTGHDAWRMYVESKA